MSGGTAHITVLLGDRSEGELRAALAGWDMQLEIVSRHPSIAEVIAYVAPIVGLTPQQLTGDGRARAIGRARALIAWFAYRCTGCTYRLIGIGLGGRDHSSILERVRRGAELRWIDEDFRVLSDALVDHFGYEAVR